MILKRIYRRLVLFIKVLLGALVGKRLGDYDKYYYLGGWEVKKEKMEGFVRQRIVEAVGINSPAKVLEIGCGLGMASYILSEMGFDVVGVDISQVAIDTAQKLYKGPKYICMDVANSPFERGIFDVILAMGMSWYHYEFLSVNKYGIDVPQRTKELFELLRPGGIFVLSIKTDFSGKRPVKGVHFNKYGDYVQLFNQCGEVFYISDGEENILKNESDAISSKGDIIIATRKRESTR